MAVRSLLMQALERGKVEFSIYIESIGKDSSAQINQGAVAGYYAQLKEISEKLGIEKPSSWAEMQQVLRFPDVIRTEVVEADEAE